MKARDLIKHLSDLPGDTEVLLGDRGMSGSRDVSFIETKTVSRLGRSLRPDGAPSYRETISTEVVLS